MVATAKMLSSTAACAAEKSLVSMSRMKCIEMEATTNMRSPNQNTMPQKASEPNASRGVRSRLGVDGARAGPFFRGWSSVGDQPFVRGAVAHQEERDGKADDDNHDSRSAGRDSPVVRVDEVLEERDQEAADAEANRRNGEGDGPAAMEPVAHRRGSGGEDAHIHPWRDDGRNRDEDNEEAGREAEEEEPGGVEGDARQHHAPRAETVNEVADDGAEDRLAACGGGEDERGRRVAYVELLGEGSQEGRETVDIETAGEG